MSRSTTPSSPTPVSRTPVAWRTAVFVVFLVNGIATGTWISRIPGIRDALDIPVSDVGILIAGLAAGSIVALLLAGHVVHWLGGRRTILITLLGAGAGVALVGAGAAVLGSFPVVFAGLMVFGFSSAMCDVAMNVEGAGVERAMKRNLMPWFHASWSLGSIAGAGVGAAAAFAGVDPAVHLGITGAVIGCAAILASRWIPATAPAEEHGERLGFRQRMGIWLEPRTLLIGLVVLGMAFAEGAANDWLALAMVDDRGLDNGQAALMFGVFTVAMTTGRIVGVPLLDRFGRVLVLRVAAVAALIGLAIVILVPVIPVTVAGIVLWGLGASLGFPVGMSAAGDDPARAAARVSAVATIAYTAFLVGPPIIGFVAEGIGLLTSMWIVLGLIALATLAIPAVREPAGRRGGDGVEPRPPVE